MYSASPGVQLIPSNFKRDVPGISFEKYTDEHDIDELNQEIYLREKIELGTTHYYPINLTQAKLLNPNDIDARSLLFIAPTGEFIKVAKEPIYNHNITHELYMGIKLKDIPNFGRVLGGGHTFLPSSVLQSEELDNHELNYIVIEGLYDYQSLAQWLPILTKEEFTNILYQILDSLHLANQRLEYTHYDFHDHNILVRRNQDHSFQVKIIDFEYNYMRDHMASDFNSYYYYPLYDVLHLLEYGLRTLEKNKLQTSELYQLLILGYQYFTYQKPPQYINYDPYNASLPITDFKTYWSQLL